MVAATVAGRGGGGGDIATDGRPLVQSPAPVTFHGQGGTQTDGSGKPIREMATKK